MPRLQKQKLGQQVALLFLDFGDVLVYARFDEIGMILMIGVLPHGVMNCALYEMNGKRKIYVREMFLIWIYKI